MAYTVFCGNELRVFDTLPALNARFAAEDANEKQIYTTARLYFEGEKLHVCLIAFEREPTPQSGVVFVLAGGDERMLYCTVNPDKASATLISAQPDMGAHLPQGEEIALATAGYFAGQDEQGWYWGAQIELSPDVLCKINVKAQKGESFRAALLKKERERLQAASHKGGQLNAELFEKCLIAEI